MEFLIARVRDTLSAHNDPPVIMCSSMSPLMQSPRYSMSLTVTPSLQIGSTGEDQKARDYHSNLLGLLE
jgi:hypothetical protein